MANLNVATSSWTTRCRLMTATAVIVFIIAYLLSVNDTAAPFDRALLLALRHPDDASQGIGPQWMPRAMRDVTSLGSNGFAILAAVAVSGYLRMQGRRLEARWLFASILGGTIASNAIKGAFGRARPDLVPHATEVTTASFPSSHAAVAALLCLSIAFLITQHTAQKPAKMFVLAVAVLLTALIGVSRVYLGVHWPTDVLGGWAFGVAWAGFASAALHWMQTAQPRNQDAHRP